jgi:hypothetical protein
MTLKTLLDNQQSISNALSTTVATATTTEKTPVNAVAATGTLTISGVAIDGETATINTDVYEFAADAAQSVTGTNVAVDITTYTTASAGTLTVDTIPTAGNTMTIGAKVYTFVTDGTASADGQIDIGTDAASAQANIVAAINGTDSINTAHTQVSAGAFAANDSIITALVGGTAGDLIATTETFTAVTNVFDAATLGTTVAGADCTAANAVTALVAADASALYVLADGAGDTVTVTAATKGTAANAYATTETMVNGAFGAATLAGGINGTVGLNNQIIADNSYIYVAIANNTIADANWRRVALGAVY